MEAPVTAVMNATKRRIFAVVSVVLFIGLSACTQPPLDTEWPKSQALPPPEGSEIVASSRRLQSQGAGLDYIVPLETGNQALGARLRVIEATAITLDLQYFLMKPDLSSAVVFEEVMRAADRGVRVRLLLDDIFTTVKDEDLFVLDSHPNLSVRVFNPAARPGPKWASMIGDFERMNRRMHNKAFIADNSLAIIGGRNLADEYFAVDPSTEFADLEIMVSGPSVKGMSAAFDDFWNDTWSVPVRELRKTPSDEALQDRREEISDQARKGRVIYERAVNDELFDEFAKGRGAIWSGDAHFVSERPIKLRTPVKDGDFKLAEKVYRSILEAKQSVLVVTPYFVPENYGAKIFSDLARRGVDVRIITNSVGSTNHVYTHAGYRRHRPGLLDAGVALNEVRPDALDVIDPDGETAGVNIVMHTKLVIIDTKRLFIGSMNFDPRSMKLNSEGGLFVDSAPLARDAVSDLDQGLDLYTYQLEKSADGEIAWVYKGTTPPTTATNEPDATAWRRFVIGLTELLNVELQL